ncbi:MAG TPA: hypothetical protein VGY52_11210 [Roseiarcus sp.]|jgi:pyruvate/2-oxoglutarate dehydrogenase complex dihydrolipoamide acyltransferase (E2) component|nr:hypothetical protein [Roseiarcus sp.]
MRKSLNFALGRKSIATALVAGGLLALSAPAAHAQFFNFFFRDGLQPVDIQSMLEDRGLELIAPLRRNGAVYVADVEGPRGGTMRLVIDANNGRIVQRFRIGSPRFDANLGVPRPPVDMGGAEPDQSAAFTGAPPAVITFGDQQGRAEDATGPNSLAVPREDGARPRARGQAKHKKIDLTPLAQPASAPAATGVKPPVHADAAASGADAKIAPAPAAAPPAAAPAAPAPSKAKPALNDVPVTPLD